MLPSNISLKLSLGGEFCQLMGYRFFPYQWLEDVCEEMIEENISKFICLLKLLTVSSHQLPYGINR